MATSINVRLSDDLEEKLKNTVESIKEKTPAGAEVNNSTVVRGALEDFIRRQEQDWNKEYNIPIVKMNYKELEQSYEMINTMLNAVKAEHYNVDSLNDLPDHLKSIYKAIMLMSLDILSKMHR